MILPVLNRCITSLSPGNGRTLRPKGVDVSPRGLAYLLPIVETAQVRGREDLQGAWREELDQLIRAPD